MIKWGVLLTRAQPFHNGHLETVKKILEENDRALIVVGSSNKDHMVRNPFSIRMRVSIVQATLLEGLPEDYSRCKIMTLADWSMESATEYAEEWGKFFYYNVVNSIYTKTFKLYYNDDISIVKRWFNDELASRVEIHQLPRINDISSTKIRDILKKYEISGDNYYYLTQAFNDKILNIFYQELHSFMTSETLTVDTMMK